VKIVNSILWNEGTELQGDGFDVSFSCVRGGFAGEGNISSDPLFVNVENPRGEDGMWRTLDDGLSLKRGSPCIDSGKDDVDISDDFIDMKRPLNSGFDMGAYEIPVLQAGDDVIDYGVLTQDNEFIHRADIGYVLTGVNRRDLYRKIWSKSALTLRVFVKKHKYTDVNEKAVKVVFRDVNGGNVGEERWITFYRNRNLETSSHYAFTSQIVENGIIKGPVIFLVAGDVRESPGDPFIVLKVADEVVDGQEYVSGHIRIKAYR
jgi:hypothetical protein